MKKNSCGPDGFPEKIREKLSVKFNEACWLHDIHYEMKQVSRKRADEIFLKSMLSKSENLKDKAIAYTYYIFVRIFGWIRYGKN